MESNPQLAPIALANDVVVVISFEIAIGEPRGMMNLCLPFGSLAPLAGQLAANSYVGAVSSASTHATAAQIGQRLAGSVVELVANLAESKITADDVLNLRVGDIITTEKGVHAPLAVSLEGVTKFRATAGQFKGRKRSKSKRRSSRAEPSSSRRSALLCPHIPKKRRSRSARLACTTMRRIATSSQKYLTREKNRDMLRANRHRRGANLNAKALARPTSGDRDR